MEVKVLPSKLKSDSLPAHDDPTRNSGGRSWEQGANRHQLQVTLVLTGRRDLNWCAIRSWRKWGKTHINQGFYNNIDDNYLIDGGEGPPL